MRIISYNINGLGAFATKNKLSDLMYDFPADVYCFQEVKADAKKVDKILSTHTEGYLFAMDYNSAGVSSIVYSTTFSLESTLDSSGNVTFYDKISSQNFTPNASWDIFVAYE